MSRRNAAVAGLLAWLVALLFAPEKRPAALAVWALFAAVAVAASIVAGRLLSRSLKRAVLKDRQ
ncbi:MAG TPA: hypothetical protein VNA20_01415 [Frankiaceae bacterium]|nr:hypothetical protein [Frankiaceae bacterium]